MADVFEKVVYAAMGIGVAVIGSGFFYVLNFESRISKLETQIGFAMGANAKADAPTPSREAGPADGGEPRAIPVSQSPAAQAIATQCANVLQQYSDFVKNTPYISSMDQTKLDSLSKLLDQMGCNKFAGK